MYFLYFNCQHDSSVHYTYSLCTEEFPSFLLHIRGIQWCIWLRHTATSWKVTGSIPNGVIGVFHWRDPFCHTVALVPTQPLTEMSTRNISWGVKVTSVLGWQPYHLHVPTVLKSGCLNFLEPLGPVQSCTGPVQSCTGPVQSCTGPVQSCTGPVQSCTGTDASTH